MHKNPDSPVSRELALANVGSVASRTTLAAALAEIDTERLTAIVTQQLRYALLVSRLKFIDVK